jgi:hypothetical protein
MIAQRKSASGERSVHRNLAPTVIFTMEETVYGIVYRPVNQLARDCCRLGGWRELTPEQRVILEEQIGFNFEVR